MKTMNGLRAATWKGDRALYITQAGIIAAVYVVLTVVFAPFAFKEVQVRISEMLTILPFFFPAAVPGVFIGCIIGNILGGAILPDIVFGSIATLIGGIGTYLIGKKYWASKDRMNVKSAVTRNLILASLPPIIANAIIVPLVLKYAYGVPMAIPLMMLTVGLGEIISCGIFGVILGRATDRIIT